jgi:hypothetical protein
MIVNNVYVRNEGKEILVGIDMPGIKLKIQLALFAPGVNTIKLIYS